MGVRCISSLHNLAHKNADVTYSCIILQTAQLPWANWTRIDFSNADLILMDMEVGSHTHQTSNADLILMDMGVESHQTSNADLILMDMGVGSQ